MIAVRGLLFGNLPLFFVFLICGKGVVLPGAEAFADVHGIGISAPGHVFLDYPCGVACRNAVVGQLALEGRACTDNARGAYLCPVKDIAACAYPYVVAEGDRALGVVAEMADRVVVMYAGQCIEEAPLAELLEHPAHAYTQSLMRAVPGIHDDRSHLLYSIPGYVPQEYGEMQGCRFAPRCPKGAECPIRSLEEWREIRPGHRTRCWIEGGAGDDR